VTDKEKAALAIVQKLRNPLALVSIPCREEAFELVKKYKLTAKDLLEAAYRNAKRDCM